MWMGFVFPLTSKTVTKDKGKSYKRQDEVNSRREAERTK